MTRSGHPCFLSAHFSAFPLSSAVLVRVGPKVKGLVDRPHRDADKRQNDIATGTGPPIHPFASDLTCTKKVEDVS